MTKCRIIALHLAQWVNYLDNSISRNVQNNLGHDFLFESVRPHVLKRFQLHPCRKEDLERHPSPQHGQADLWWRSGTPTPGEHNRGQWKQRLTNQQILNKESTGGQRGEQPDPMTVDIKFNSPFETRCLAAYIPHRVDGCLIQRDQERTLAGTITTVWRKKNRGSPSPRRAPQRCTDSESRHRKSFLTGSQDHELWNKSTHSLLDDFFLWLNIFLLFLFYIIFIFSSLSFFQD